MDIRNLKSKIEKEYKYRIELHAHTSPVSACSDILPEQLAKIYHEKGYDAVVVTNHFNLPYGVKTFKNEFVKRYMTGYEETKKAAQELGLLVLLGAEIRFTENDNDYLLYGVDEELLYCCYDYLEKGLLAFRGEVKLDNSVFLQAHPMRDGIALVDASLLDGFETFNVHPNHNSRIGLSVRYAKENNALVKIAGSDFHHFGQEAVSALRTKVLPRDSFELAKILKSGDYAIEIGEDSIVLP